MKSLQVDLGDRSYPIYIGAGLLSEGGLLRRHITGRQVMVVSSESVAALYLEHVSAQLDGYQLSTLVLPDGETHKNLATVERVFDKLMEDRHNRTTTLIALGGGVVGDIAGFSAACYQRGVNFIQIPTTLLAQVDSSVGGKTGVNHPLGKNMIGAFYQPQCVLVDTAVLQTLPPREFKAGLAEVIKYGLICDPDLFSWLEENYQQVLDMDTHALAHIIERSCANKAAVVAEDERESGIRAILNLGHTFGHAIETHQSYGEWLHGEAVAAGMVMAADLSARLGWLHPADAERAKRLLKNAGLPVAPPENMTEDCFLELMAVDKKVLDGRLRLVLLKAIGQAVVTEEFDLGILKMTLAAADKLCRL